MVGNKFQMQSINTVTKGESVQNFLEREASAKESQEFDMCTTLNIPLQKVSSMSLAKYYNSLLSVNGNGSTAVLEATFQQQMTHQLDKEEMPQYFFETQSDSCSTFSDTCSIQRHSDDIDKKLYFRKMDQSELISPQKSNSSTDSSSSTISEDDGQSSINTVVLGEVDLSPISYKKPSKRRGNQALHHDNCRLAIVDSKTVMQENCSFFAWLNSLPKCGSASLPSQKTNLTFVDQNFNTQTSCSLTDLTKYSVAHSTQVVPFSRKQEVPFSAARSLSFDSSIDSLCKKENLNYTGYFNQERKDIFFQRWIQAWRRRKPKELKNSIGNSEQYSNCSSNYKVLNSLFRNSIGEANHVAVDERTSVLNQKQQNGCSRNRSAINDSGAERKIGDLLNEELEDGEMGYSIEDSDGTEGSGDIEDFDDGDEYNCCGLSNSVTEHPLNNSNIQKKYSKISTPKKCIPPPNVKINEPITLKYIDEEKQEIKEALIYSDDTLEDILKQSTSGISQKEILEKLLQRSKQYKGKALNIVLNVKETLQDLKRYRKWWASGDFSPLFSNKAGLEDRKARSSIGRRRSTSNNKPDKSEGSQKSEVQNKWRINTQRSNDNSAHLEKTNSSRKNSSPNDAVSDQKSVSSLSTHRDPRDDKKSRIAMKRVNVEEIISSEFKKFFHFYAKLGGRLKSGAVISKTNSNYWLRRTGVVSDTYTLKIADDCFAEVARRKLVLNIFDYVQYLVAIARRKRITLTDLVIQLMNVEFQNPVARKLHFPENSSRTSESGSEERRWPLPKLGRIYKNVLGNTAKTSSHQMERRY